MTISYNNGITLPAGLTTLNALTGGLSPITGITLGESGGGGNITPNDLNGGLWFDGTDAATLSLSTLAVNSITDKKQGLVASEAGANRPNQSATAQINGLKVLEFRPGGASGQRLRAANTPFASYYSSGNFTAIHIFKYLGSGAESGLLMGFNTNLANIMSQLHPFASLGNMYFDWGNASGDGRISGVTPASVLANNYVVVTCRKQTGTGYQEIRVNGVLLVGSPLSGVWTPGTFLFEIGSITGVDLYQSYMDWAESIMPDQYVSDADMNNLGNGYLFNKYGIAWNNI